MPRTNAHKELTTGFTCGKAVGCGQTPSIIIFLFSFFLFFGTGLVNRGAFSVQVGLLYNVGILD